MKIVSQIIFLLLCSLYSLLANSTVLELDTGGHMAQARKVIITRSGDIITASDDKTIRIWDGKNGTEKRKVLGEIEDGFGEIYAIALSKDEKYLAVGGYFRDDEIRIYDYKSGKMLKILESHDNVVLDLTFGDNDLLISGGADGVIKIWKNFELQNSIDAHDEPIYGVKIVNGNIVSVAEDYRVALHSIEGKLLNSYEHDQKLRNLATNGKHIAACGFLEDNVLIFDANLNLIKKLEVEGDPAGLKYSPDGTMLFVGNDLYTDDLTLWDSTNYKKIAGFNEHDGGAITVGFLDNDTALSIGGKDNDIYIWDIHSGKPKRKIEGMGTAVKSVGIRSGEKIGFGNEWTENLGRSKLTRSFDLSDFSLSSFLLGMYERIKTENGDYSLSHTDEGDFGRDDGTLVIKKEDEVVASITRDNTNGYGHDCYGWYNDYIISGGSNGKLLVYDKNGEEVAELLGHRDKVRSLAISSDRLISGSDDQTIKIWNLKEIGNEYDIFPLLTLFIDKKGEWVLWSESGYYNASVGGSRYIGYHVNRGKDKEALFVKSESYFSDLYRPDVISAILKTGTEEDGIIAANKIKEVHYVDVAKRLPPQIILQTRESFTTEKKSEEIAFSIESKSDITKLTILRNGSKIDTKALLKSKSNAKKIKIALEDGENIIAIQAQSNYATSDEVLLKIYKKSDAKTIRKPTLYLLSIGIDNYKSTLFNLQTAANDANTIAEIFKAQERKSYQKVVSKILTDSEATTKNIQSALKWLETKPASNDIAMLFISGHGINNAKNSYYILSSDANPDMPEKSAVAWQEIENTLATVPSKTLLFLDTARSDKGDNTKAIMSLINNGTGTIIVSATTGSQYSLKKLWQGAKNGAFTQALFEAVGESKADRDNNGEVHIKELETYTVKRVEALSGNAQKPTVYIPKSMPDFIFALTPIAEIRAAIDSSCGAKQWDRCEKAITSLYAYPNVENAAEIFHYAKEGCEAGYYRLCLTVAECYDLGIDGLVSQDVAKAHTLYKKACEHSVAEACNYMGYVYEVGENIEQNYDKASEFYQKACEDEFAMGCANLANFYLLGNGVNKDLEKAFQLYDRACKGGDEGGCNNLGTFYERGEILEKDFSKAFALYKRACDGGYMLGCSNTANLYTNGKGVEKDNNKAFELFQKACDNEVAEGCFNLGVFYDQGRSVEEDEKEAKRLYKQACDLGLKKGCKAYKGWSIKSWFE